MAKDQLQTLSMSSWSAAKSSGEVIWNNRSRLGGFTININYNGLGVANYG